MYFSLPLGILILISLSGHVSGRTTEQAEGELIGIATGHLYYIDSLTGASERLRRRHVENADERHNIRLELRSEGRILDMALKQGSVWTKDSKVVARHGDYVEEIPVEIDSACFLAGPLTSEDGVASLNYCEGVSGVIHTRDVDYLIDSIASSDDDEEEEFPELTVQMLTPTNDYTPLQNDDHNDEHCEMHEDGEICERDVAYNDTEDDGQDNEVMVAKRGCLTVRLLSRIARPDRETVSGMGSVTSMKVKREFSNSICAQGRTFGWKGQEVYAKGGCRADFEVCLGGQSSTGSGGSSGGQTGSGSGSQQNADGIAAEVGVWVDQYFATYLKSQGKSNDQAVVKFMINKWNAVAQVYGNKADVGVAFDIQLKYVEVWWKDPGFYASVQANQVLGNHLNVFCRNTAGSGDYDHRMLYTINVGGNVMGIAYVGGICSSTTSCSVVRSRTDRVRVEIHEFGHNLGFPHQPQMEPCNGAGFMGWDNTYNFPDCYRTNLLKYIKLSSRSCLYKNNVNKGKLN